MVTIPRGAEVYYAGWRLFFQSNGASCYLYARKEDVGRRHLAVFSPGSASVTYPCPADAATPPGDLAPIHQSPVLIEAADRFLRGRLSLLLGLPSLF